MSTAITPHTDLQPSRAWSRRVTKLLSAHEDMYGSRLDRIILKQIENAEDGSIASARFLFEIMKSADVTLEQTNKPMIDGFNLNDYIIETEDSLQPKKIETKTKANNRTTSKGD